MTEVEQFRQEEYCRGTGIDIVSFPLFRFLVDRTGELHSFEVIQDSSDVGHLLVKRSHRAVASQ